MAVQLSHAPGEACILGFTMYFGCASRFLESPRQSGGEFLQLLIPPDDDAVL
jgi:hypothetical protein